MANTTGSSVKGLASGAKVASIGTVKSVLGTVTATDASGVTRDLQVGDKVFINDVIQTSGDGVVLVEFVNGTHADLGRDSNLVLDADVFNPEQVASDKSDIASIQAQIAAGADPTLITEAPAAGPGASDEGGSSFVVVDQLAPQGLVTSGFPTEGISVAFNLPANQLGEPISTPPGNAEGVVLTVQEAGIAAHTAVDAQSSAFVPGSSPLAGIGFSGAAPSISGDYADASINWVLSADHQTLSGTVQGEAGPSIVLTLSGVNLASGAYTVNVSLSDEFTHSSGAGNNSFTINGVEVVATDVHGASATGLADITVVDDVPSIAFTGGDTSVVEGGTVSDGTWTSSSGADTPAPIKVVFNGTDYDLGQAIDTGKGTLTVAADNTWTFVAANGLDQDTTQSISFGLKITDADGDVRTDSYSVGITDGQGPLAGGAVNLTVHEAQIVDSEHASSSFTLGSDALASIGFSGAAPSISGDYADASINWVLSGDHQTLSGTVAGEASPSIVLTLSGVNLASGAYTVNVSLSDEFTHSSGAGNNSFTINGVEVVATDIDGTSATGLATVTVVDDVPTAVVPDYGVLANEAGSVASFDLDLDQPTSTLSNNYGADGGTVRFAPSLDGSWSGLTINGGATHIIYDVSGDGLTLFGKAGSVTGATVFTVSLDPTTATYSVHMSGTVDSLTTVDFSGGGYNFVGGNNAWNGFVPVGESLTSPADNNSHDLLLTPELNGVNGSTINSSANSGGVGSGASVGDHEIFRIDFVVDLRGDPGGSGGYGVSANRDHVFDQHYTTNGSSATFTATSGSVVNFAAFDDHDGNMVVGDGSHDPIVAIAISFGDASQLITPTLTSSVYNVGGHTFTVQANSDGTVNVGGIFGTSGSNPAGTDVAVYTSNGYNSVEYSYVSGDTFKIGDFGASVQTTNPVNFEVPVQVVDGDGDIANSLIGMTLVGGCQGVQDWSSSASPVIKTSTLSAPHIIGSDFNDQLTGDSGNNVLSGGLGDDILTGGTGNDLLIGGVGNDTMSGGDGHDTFLFGADSFTLPGNDVITNFTIGDVATNANADILKISDVLTGAHAANAAIPDNLTDALSGGFLSVQTVDSTTARVVLDLDGTGGSSSAVTIVTLQNVPVADHAALLTTLLGNHELT
ncbi:MAG: retention module-containing protein [Bacteroidota bacterium]